ncbi:hypothetical protein PFISCL1PPCAC_13909, partial [Pristionchus fissidentatus]
MISQIRFNFRLDAQDEYNCSLAEVAGAPPINWSSRGVSRPYFGLFCILFGCLAIPFYVIIARIIWRMRKMHTYKIMFVLAISDIGTLCYNSISFGFLLMNGEVYCMHPKINFAFAITSGIENYSILQLFFSAFIALFTPLFFFDSVTHTVMVNPKITDKYQ